MLKKPQDDQGSADKREFKEIAHCGGKYCVEIRTSEDGRQVGSFGARGFAGALFAIYALPEGVSVAMVQMGGIGDPWNPPPHPSCYPVFIASDSEGLFGHQCYKCEGYWRSTGPPSRWLMTCPYCGHQAESHQFLTQGQVAYVEAFCNMVSEALRACECGSHVIDMDEISRSVLQGKSLPNFYYAGESQQNRFSCEACRAKIDILGRYGYCSRCGTHNGLQELREELNRLRLASESRMFYETAVKNAVGAFDSFARQIAKQLALRVPMTLRRRRDWERKLFHDIRSRANDLSAVFDIDLFRHLSKSEEDHAVLLFHRRHVYEHNGGEADEKYIRDSGDTSVRVKQALRESENSLRKAIELISCMGENLHYGFHAIFPGVGKALSA